MDRTQRQHQGVQKWVDNKCRGTFNYATGTGKTYTSILCLKRFLSKNPGRSILVVVPTDYLKKQWLVELTNAGIFMCCEVVVINTIIKHTWTCDVLVLDEIHGYASDLFGKVFQQVSYKMIIGLTATIERLDGKETYIIKYCPVIDTITLDEAVKNGWLSPYKEYKILLDVDLTTYLEDDQNFKKCFSFFDFNFDLAMKCVTDWTARLEYAKVIYSGSDPKKKTEVNKLVLANAFGFSKSLHKRKEFIYNHPKKVEIANLILEHRQDKKAITFSPTIKVAEKIKYGFTLHSKQTKKKRGLTMDEFIPLKEGVLNTSKSLDEGADIPGLNLAIILGVSSSSRQKVQRIGRTVRKAEGKVAEVFTLVLKGTVEDEWFRRSASSENYITLDEHSLTAMLKGEEFTPKKNSKKQLILRF